MLEAEIIEETKKYIKCIDCGKKTEIISHLINNEGKEIGFGPWFCNHCGTGYNGKVIGDQVYITKCDRRKTDLTVILKKDNILLGIRGMTFDKELDHKSKQYFYEEHDCPSNYLQDVDFVVDLDLDNGFDPHGLFEYITAVPYIDDTDENFNNFLSDVIKKVKNKESIGYGQKLASLFADIGGYEI